MLHAPSGAVMFKFLKVFTNTPDQKPELETMRARFERVTAELNEVLEDLEELPDVSLDVSGRRVTFNAPEQFSDEALALPKPDADELKASAKTDDHVETAEPETAKAEATTPESSDKSPVRSAA
jgi:hypothetical protein